MSRILYRFKIWKNISEVFQKKIDPKNSFARELESFGKKVSFGDYLIIKKQENTVQI
jgi:hypothetical protein